MDWVFASNNPHKLREIRAILPDSMRLLSLEEVGFHAEIPETGDTLEENAKIKAETIFKFCGKPVFADDTGLFVPALDGAPGVRSARYAGEDATYSDNCELLLKNMQGKSDRSASFVTILCMYISGAEIRYFRGEIKGSIAVSGRGSKGFGYDPLFIPEGNTATFAEMNAAEKNNISHRKLAIEQMTIFLSNLEA